MRTTPPHLVVYTSWSLTYVDRARRPAVAQTLARLAASGRPVSWITAEPAGCVPAYRPCRLDWTTTAPSWDCGPGGTATSGPRRSSARPTRTVSAFASRHGTARRQAASKSHEDSSAPPPGPSGPRRHRPPGPGRARPGSVRVTARTAPCHRRYAGRPFVARAQQVAQTWRDSGLLKGWTTGFVPLSALTLEPVAGYASNENLRRHTEMGT